MKIILAFLACVALPLATTGQTPAPADPAKGITATGKGVALSPVTTVLVRVIGERVANENDFLAAISAAGVEQAYVENGRTGQVAVHGRLTNVTRAKTDAVTNAATAYAGAHLPMVVTDISFYGLATDCPAIEQRARATALADARRRASAIASSTNMNIGEQIAVAESGGCPQVGISGGGTRVDVATMSMRVLVTDTVTFTTTK